MADVQVRPEETDDGWRFNVRVGDVQDHTDHTVTLTRKDRARFGEDVDPETLVRESFRFLLEREPKEDILPSFDLTMIGRYFPEYEKEIRDRV